MRREEEEEGGSLMRKREVTADEDVITLWCEGGMLMLVLMYGRWWCGGGVSVDWDWEDGTREVRGLELKDVRDCCTDESW